MDDLALWGVARAGLTQRTAQIDPVEAQDRVGVADQLGRIAAYVEARWEGMQWVLRWKARTGLDIGEDDRADVLGERDTTLKIDGIARHATDHQQWSLCAIEQSCYFRHDLLRDRARTRDRSALERGRRHWRGEALLLQRGVEANVHRPVRLVHGDPVAAHDRF